MAAEMRGMMMTPPLLPFLGIWVTGMVAMMLPSLVPAARLVEHVGSSVPRFVAGYLVVWSALGVAAFGLARAIGDHHALTLAALALAGAYQVTPFKRACLRRCRSPVGVVFLPPLGAGVRHGFDCAGCCAGLMLVLVAVGVMSILWMAIVAAAIFVEKVTPIGAWVNAL